MAEAPLTSLVVSPEQARQAEVHLSRLLADTNASFALLLDRSGQLITSRGNPPAGNPLTLGALLAGTFAAAREVARALHEEDFRTFFQQGQHLGVLSSLIGEQWLLAVVFDERTPLGLVKVLAARTVKGLEEILAQVRAAQPIGRMGSKMAPGLRASLEEAIDSLFKE